MLCTKDGPYLELVHLLLQFLSFPLPHLCPDLVLATPTMNVYLSNFSTFKFQTPDIALTHPHDLVML